MSLGSRFYQEATRYMHHDPPGLCNMIREGLESKDFKSDDFSIRRLAEATIGPEFVRACGGGGSDFQRFMEAAGSAVTTSAFSNITGQVFYTKILESATNPAFIGDQLCTTIPTQLSGEKMPGITEMGDDAEMVNEGMPYPFVGVGQEYIETPETTKKGMIVPVTREAIFFDRTGLLLQRCGNVGYWMGVKKEKAVISLVTGTTNSYKRNGTAYNTYAASGGHGIVNQYTQTLVNHTDLQGGYDLFADMTEFNTGEPIVVMPNTLLVCHSLLPTAHYIMSSTQVRGGTSNTSAYQTISVDPIKSLMPLSILSSPLVESVTSQTAYYWIGDFPKAFAYMQNWGIETTNRSAGTDADFYRDIVQEYKVSERGIPAVLDPHFVVRSTGAG